MIKLLEIKDVSKQYGSNDSIVNAVNKVTFTVDHGEFIGIMGSSGSGKTTLLNIISTIDSVTNGNIEINGKDITKISEEDIAKFRRENLGFIFQDFNLLDTLTLHENIALALTIQDNQNNEVDTKVENVADQLGIKSILKKFPYEVSGGQKQRCACARAIITNPKLILADEPTGALDSNSAQMILETMSGMNKDFSATILMVTHDAFSASYCKRVLFMKDGKIFKEIYRNDRSRKDLFHEILDIMATLGGHKCILN